MILSILFVCSIIIVGIFNIAGMSAIGNDVRRTFVEMPINLVKSAVGVDITNYPNYEAYFSDKYLEDNVKNYLSKSLKGKVPSYSLGFTYFNYKENGQFEFGPSIKPKFVQIKFVCKYFLNYKIDEYLTFDARKI